MNAAQRIATIAAATTIGFAAMSMPAMATSRHWTKAQCKTYQKGFESMNPHANKTKRADANKILKLYRCKNTVK